ncbi:MAG: hypothetical protein ACKO96_30605, partial [Flammeovirgaceae bacterium]
YKYLYRYPKLLQHLFSKEVSSLPQKLNLLQGLKSSKVFYRGQSSLPYHLILQNANSALHEL